MHIYDLILDTVYEAKKLHVYSFMVLNFILKQTKRNLLILQ